MLRAECMGKFYVSVCASYLFRLPRLIWPWRLDLGRRCRDMWPPRGCRSATGNPLGTITLCNDLADPDIIYAPCLRAYFQQLGQGCALCRSPPRSDDTGWWMPTRKALPCSPDVTESFHVNSQSIQITTTERGKARKYIFKLLFLKDDAWNSIWDKGNVHLI